VLKATGWLILAYSCYGQSSEQRPSFEVASVKLAAPRIPGAGEIFGTMHGGPGTTDPGRITYRAVLLNQVVLEAFGVRQFQISGPSWLAGRDGDRFDIVANVPLGTSKEQFRSMVQGLLVERFNLKFHYERKDFPVYELVVGKNGFKLNESTQDKDTARQTGRFPPPGLILTRPGDGGTRLSATAVSISMLATTLQGQIGGFTVLDKTGLAGKYDIDLEFSPSALGSQDSATFPSLSTALQQDLGLQLVKKTASLDVLVIERLNKTPTEN
jgi:uncharacterized protein (TIGR03435 family)